MLQQEKAVAVQDDGTVLSDDAVAMAADAAPKQDQGSTDDSTASAAA
jgi:hypothetical protein